MWGWLKAIFSALFDALFKWGQEQAEKPPTLKDAKTPEEIKKSWDDYTTRQRDKLRDENGHGN